MALLLRSPTEARRPPLISSGSSVVGRNVRRGAIAVIPSGRLAGPASALLDERVPCHSGKDLRVASITLGRSNTSSREIFFDHPLSLISLFAASPAASPTSWPTRSSLAGRSASPSRAKAGCTTRSRGWRRHIHWLAWRPPGPRGRGGSALRRSWNSVAPDVVHLQPVEAGLAARLVLLGPPPNDFQPHSWSFEAGKRRVRKGAVAGSASRTRAHVSCA